MKQFKIILMFISVTIFAGCATFSDGMYQEEIEACIWGTALVGTVVGGSAGGPIGAMAGTFVGTLGGLVQCRPEISSAPMVADEPGYFWPDDQDRDGVLDRDDKCPFTPDGVAVDSDGCPLDADGDGVPDYLDKCPGTPLGAVVDTDGCPRTLLTLQDVNFAFDSAQLTSQAKTILDSAVAAINANPSDSITIEGHTDSMGSDAYNSQLSQRRARAVVDYLSSKGVSASRMKAVGKGESNPIASNDTREGRSLNRRVVILAK